MAALTQPQQLTQGARRLYFDDNSATPVFTQIPIHTCEEQNQAQNEKTFTSVNVDVTSGTAYEDGVITGYATSYTAESPFYLGTQATPAIMTGLATIKACKRKGGATCRKHMTLVEGDGTATQAWVDVLDVQSVKGDQKAAMALSWKMEIRGVPTDLTATQVTALSLLTTF